MAVTVRFMESGGQYHFSNGLGPGVWNGSAVINTNAVLRNGNGVCYGQASGLTTPLLTGTGFGGMIAGCALNVGSVLPGTAGALIAFQDNNSNNQCELRNNSSGQWVFTRNGTSIGGTSTAVITTNVWNYVEFRAIFSNAGAGTCEVALNGTVVLTSTSLTNAQNAAGGWKVNFGVPNNGLAGMMDFYVLDTGGGLNTTYLGDVSVSEIYPNGAGVNSAWAVFQPSFVLTSAGTASGGTTVYQGTITNGASPANAWQGFYFVVSGFVTGANNGTFLCSASNATSITLVNAGGVAETHAGTCAFQNPLQAGIHGGFVDNATTNLGTRPPADNQYIVDSTPGDKSDFGHQALTFTGNIAAIGHVTQARKDDAGTRQIAQICESSGTEELSATITLNTTYQYYLDVLEADPHTATLWTQTGFNSATFGVKEIA